MSLGRFSVAVALALGVALIAPSAQAAGFHAADAQTEHSIQSVLAKSPGAVRTGDYTVAWQDGAVIETWLPHTPTINPKPTANKATTDATVVPASTPVVSSCPDGTSVHWYCFYQDANWAGRMLQFKDCGSTQNLGDYGFNNETTSWANNRPSGTGSIYVYSGGGTLLWIEGPRSRSSNVGATNNDRAWTFHTYC